MKNKNFDFKRNKIIQPIINGKRSSDQRPSFEVVIGIRRAIFYPVNFFPQLIYSFQLLEKV